MLGLDPPNYGGARREQGRAPDPGAPPESPVSPSTPRGSHRARRTNCGAARRDWLSVARQEARRPTAPLPGKKRRRAAHYGAPRRA